MKTGKRVLSIILVTLMLLTAAPLAGFVGLEFAPKAKALDATGQCGDNVYWNFDSSTGTLTISGTGAMTDYLSGSPFYFNSSIKSITISNGITSIGDHAFSGCSSLTSVTIPNSVKRIGSSAFYYCIRLTRVTIPDSVTIIDDRAFDWCSGLASIKISNNVTSINSGVFEACNSLTSVTIPTSVTNIGGLAFNCCSSLTSLTIPDSVTSIDSSAFRNCSGLKSITISNHLTDLSSGVFEGCSSLTSVTIPDSITEIGIGAFIDCSSLKDLTIPNSVKSIKSSAFSGCNSLTDVYYSGTQAQWNRIDIDSYYNEPLANATIHYNFYGETQTNKCGDNAYWMCPLMLTTRYLMILGSGAIWDYDNENAPWYDEYGTEIERVSISEGITKIGNRAFYGLASLNSADLPNGIETIGAKAFANSTLLEITLPSSLKSIGEAVFKNTQLQRVVLPEGIQTIEQSTFENTQLTRVNIPTTVTTISKNAFKGCDILSDVFYQGSESQWNSILIESGNECLTNASRFHFGSTIDYNLGDETYSFENYTECIKGQSCYGYGHCFGMAATSSMYHLGLLNKSVFGGDDSKPLYSFMESSQIKKPICHYQGIQGKTLRNALVAGGYFEMHGNLFYRLLDAADAFDLFYSLCDIESDWEEVINYLKSHKYDNEGNRLIQFCRKGKKHAVNFLRYEEVDSQQRIYIYDNNEPGVPGTEAYIFKDSNGFVREMPEITFSGSIDSIGVIDVVHYFNLAKEFKASRTIYASGKMININSADISLMTGDIENDRFMFELPNELEEVEITPLVDNAEFSYLGKTYKFEEIDEDTYGVLTLSKTDEEDPVGSTLVIQNAPESTHSHIDTDNDGHCDNCGEQMQGGDHCKFCGKIHNGGFFDKLMGFFHKIFAIFKR